MPIADNEVGENVVYFNALVSLYITNLVLTATECKTIPVKKDFIRDLTYRNLSRSSIEMLVILSCNLFYAILLCWY